MQASGSLVEVDILELSESPWPGIGIFHTIMGLEQQMVEELDLKLTLGKAERRQIESPPDKDSSGGSQRFKSWSDPKVTPSLSQSLAVSCPIGYSTGRLARVLNKDQKRNKTCFQAEIRSRDLLNKSWKLCPWATRVYTQSLYLIRYWASVDNWKCSWLASSVLDKIKIKFCSFDGSWKGTLFVLGTPLGTYKRLSVNMAAMSTSGKRRKYKLWICPPHLDLKTSHFKWQPKKSRQKSI